MKKFYSLLLITLFGLFSSYAQTIDESFVKPIPYKAAKINVIKELSDGKILLGGKIDFYKDKKVNNLIRLNADYSLDETFVFTGDPKLEVRDAKFQSNGNIIVVMDNSTALAADHYALHQLNQNGEILSSITDLIMAKSIAIQADDKVLVTGGEIDAYGSKSCYLHRYNSDFSLDETFNNDLAFNASTNTVVVSTEGIYVGGTFTTVNGITKNGLIKLNSDGILDTTFDIGEGAKGSPFSLTLQDDNKLLIGSNFFSTIENTFVSHMIRLNPDGTIDPGFSCQYGSYFSSVVTPKDSSIYIAAEMVIDNENNIYLIKLNSDGSLNEDFIPSKLNKYSYLFAMGIVEDKILYNSSGNFGNKYGLSACDLSGNKIESQELKPTRFGTIESGAYFDGKLIIYGDFIKVNDVETFGIGLFDQNGTVDKSFLFGNYLGDIRQFQIMDDDTIYFSTLTKLVKLNSKGEVLKDFDFKNDTSLTQMTQFKVLSDGKIIATDGERFLKLNNDGTVDFKFNFNPSEDFWNTAIKFDLQGDKIICAVTYVNFSSTIYNDKIIRFNLDGSVDETFKVNGSGPDRIQEKMKVLESGEVIVAGGFFNYNGLSVPNQIVKLSKNGEMDLKFNDNLSLFQVGYAQNHDYRKIEEIDSVLYITEGDAKVTAINLDGTLKNNLEVSDSIDKINDIIVTSETAEGEESSETSRKAKSQTNDNFLYAIGTKNETNAVTSVIIKINLGKSSGSLGLDPTLEKENSAVKMYPVPVQENLNVTFSNAVSPQKIAVYSLEGKELYSANAENKSEIQVDMSKFATGVYFIKLSSDSGVVTKKIIKR